MHQCGAKMRGHASATIATRAHSSGRVHANRHADCRRAPAAVAAHTTHSAHMHINASTAACRDSLPHIFSLPPRLKSQHSAACRVGNPQLAGGVAASVHHQRGCWGGGVRVRRASRGAAQYVYYTHTCFVTILLLLLLFSSMHTYSSQLVCCPHAASNIRLPVCAAIWCRAQPCCHHVLCDARGKHLAHCPDTRKRREQPPNCQLIHCGHA